jgi:hypothetical protein
MLSGSYRAVIDTHGGEASWCYDKRPHTPQLVSRTVIHECWGRYTTMVDSRAPIASRARAMNSFCYLLKMHDRGCRFTQRAASKRRHTSCRPGKEYVLLIDKLLKESKADRVTNDQTQEGLQEGRNREGRVLQRPGKFAFL